MASSAPRVVAPEPPADLHTISLPLHPGPTLVWYRINDRNFPNPVFWSRRGKLRFDSSGAKWGVYYAAESVTAALQEVFGDDFRKKRPFSWNRFLAYDAWRFEVGPGLKGLELAGPNLATIRATLQSFVGSYPKSQRWGAALMNHPDDIDALLYLGRKSGAHCIALFGDDKATRPHQASLVTTNLGPLVSWRRLFSTLLRFRLRISNFPASRPPSLFDAP